VAEGSPAELIERYATREVLELRFPPGAAPPVESLARHVDRVEELPDRMLLYTGDGEHAHTEVVRAGHHPLSALVRRSTLEDVFLRLTGRSLVE
jgi:lipooligosaccharide transport system ATP-binding protein